jgi:hypothetical protein
VVGTALTKTFGPTVIGRNGTSTITFTITNGAGNPAQSGLAFLENLPANLFVATPPAVVNGCGGTVTAVAGAGTLDLAGGVLALAASSCTVAVNVTSAFVGSYSTARRGSRTRAHDGHLGRERDARRGREPRGDQDVHAGLGGALDQQRAHASRSPTPTRSPITGAAFTDTYPGTVLNAPTPGVTNSCGGSVTAVAATNSLALTRGTIPANGSCTVTVNVRSASAGSFTNTIAWAVTSANAGANSVAATAQLDVLRADHRREGVLAQPGRGGIADHAHHHAHQPERVRGGHRRGIHRHQPRGRAQHRAAGPGATTCGGPPPVVTAANNGTTVALASAVVPAGGPCTVTCSKSAAAGGAYLNTIAIGDVTTTNAGSNTAVASATLNAYSPPHITKAFGATIGPPGVDDAHLHDHESGGEPRRGLGHRVHRRLPGGARRDDALRHRGDELLHGLDAHRQRRGRARRGRRRRDRLQHQPQRRRLVHDRGQRDRADGRQLREHQWRDHGDDPRGAHRRHRGRDAHRGATHAHEDVSAPRRSHVGNSITLVFTLTNATGKPGAVGAVVHRHAARGPRRGSRHRANFQLELPRRAAAMLTQQPARSSPRPCGIITVTQRGDERHRGHLRDPRERDAVPPR